LQPKKDDTYHCLCGSTQQLKQMRRGNASSSKKSRLVAQKKVLWKYHELKKKEEIFVEALTTI
jgi:hypothetical protein